MSFPLVVRAFSLALFFASLPVRPAWGMESQAGGTPYEKVKSFLQQTAAQNPQTTRMISIGQSDEGQSIDGLAIGSGPVNNLVVATHHGNEYGSTEVAKAMTTALAQHPIQGQTVYVIPVLNISGYNRNSRWEKANGRNYDANRDYPGPCGSEGPFKLRSTAALARFLEEKQIVASATLHTFYPAVVYPWGLASRDLNTPYTDLFKLLVEAATLESHYQWGNSTEVIYPANGTFEDYAYWQHGIWSILFELGASHSPDPKAVEEMVRLNVPGLRRMFEQAPRERAENHAFGGRCDQRLFLLDRHDE